MNAAFPPVISQQRTTSFYIDDILVRKPSNPYGDRLAAMRHAMSTAALAFDPVAFLPAPMAYGPPFGHVAYAHKAVDPAALLPNTAGKYRRNVPPS